MLTIFSTAKPFTGHFGVIQRNALTSWAALGSEVEVLMFGDEAGLPEICDELGFRNVRQVARSDKGTPLVSDMFRQAAAYASNGVLCFVNADVILAHDTVDAARSASEQRERFLLVAQRRDIEQLSAVDLRDGAQLSAIRERARTEGTLMSPIWIDWFVFPRSTYNELPDFAIGRSGYDNYLIWQAADVGADVIDCTDAVLLVHQFHDYSHGGGKAAVWEGSEARRAAELVGSWRRYHSVAHARYRMTTELRIETARGGKYAMARPRQFASHLLRFTRPFRRRWHGQGSSRSVASGREA